MFRAIPATIITLGLVSLMMDVSSEMIHSVLPAYLVGVLGLGTIAVGLIEGIAESTSMIIRIFSGYVSDAFRKRKFLAAFGYAVSAFTKPLFPLAHGLNLIVIARFVDRIGKGIRSAPRNAMIAEISPEDKRGTNFGFHKAMDTAGAVVGPLIAVALLYLYKDNFKLVFWAAVAPAFLCVFIMLFFVKEPEKPAAAGAPKKEFLSFKDIGKIPKTYWWIIAAAVILNFARFSNGFLVLKFSSYTVNAAMIPLALLTLNAVQAFMSYPIGALSDKIGFKRSLSYGIIILMASFSFLAAASGQAQTLAGIAVFGLHLCFTEGVMNAMISKTVEKKVMATAYGMYNFFVGIALLISNLFAGFIWKQLGPSYMFLAGVLFGLVSLAVVILKIKDGNEIN